MAALALLAARRSAALNDALLVAADDPSPQLRRAAIGLMGDREEPAFVPVLLRAALRDPCDRVRYRAQDGLAKHDPALVVPALDAALAALPLPYAGDRAALQARVCTSASIADYLREANDRALELKKRVRAVRTFRLYRLHNAVPLLLDLAAAAGEEPELRTTAIDALGWYHYSLRRPLMERVLQQLAADDKAPAAVRAEATKTLRRFAAGANDPLLP
jgi:hypothetical protein